MSINSVSSKRRIAPALRDIRNTPEYSGFRAGNVESRHAIRDVEQGGRADSIRTRAMLAFGIDHLDDGLVNLEAILKA